MASSSSWASWTRWTHTRRLLALACAGTALTALLSGCGSSTVDSVASPSRIIAFGDAVSDVGQQNGKAYTVNDGTASNWSAQFASYWGHTVTPVNSGGLSYAQGNARVDTIPDATGSTLTPSIAGQINRFLQSYPQGFTGNDFVLINGGMSDLIAGMMAVRAQEITPATYQNEARVWGAQLGAQVRRLVNAGATHVVLVGPYNLGVTPWGRATAQTDLLLAATEAFTTGLKVSINDLGQWVQYVDLEYYVNIYTQAPATYAFDNVDTPVCTSVDTNNGIGIGAGQINSLLCDTTTLRSGADYSRYVFADGVYLTPSAQRQFGAHARDLVRQRW